MKRCVFFISDGTGITAESLGQSLLTQFEHIEFDCHTVPFVDTLEKAQKVVDDINQMGLSNGHRPIIISTIVDQQISQLFKSIDAFMMDIFTCYLSPLEQELKQHSTHHIGRVREIDANPRYTQRIDAVHFALENDDGCRTRDYNKADLILVGVSRCGKTPTCLYLAMQFGIRAANYPFTEDDMDNLTLSSCLKEHQHKLFGLTIDAERLSAIRQERRSNSRYASLRQCQQETKEVELLLQKQRIPFINTTHLSVEEISTRILSQVGIERRF